MPFEDLTGVKRQIWRLLLLAVMSLQLFSLIYNQLQRNAADEVGIQLQQHYVDADSYHRQREDIGAARAKAAVMLINAVADGRTFTAAERKQISDLWHSADFDKIQEKFLNGKNE